MDPETTLFLAGERVAAGCYRRLDVNAAIRLEHEDYLPASLDGRVACYVYVAPSQSQSSTTLADLGLIKGISGGGHV